MSTRRVASRLTMRLRAGRDIPAPPSARSLDVLDRVGTRETRARDDDRRASASGAGPLPRGFAASCAAPALSFSEPRETRNARGWTLPPPPGAARARASSSSAARARSSPSSEEATDEARGTRGEADGRVRDDSDDSDDSKASSWRVNLGVLRPFRTFERLPEGTAAICVTSGVLMAGHACVAPALPAFAAELGATAAQVGMSLSAFALARLLLNQPAGAFADEKGRRPLLVAGPLITALGMFGCASAGSLPELLFHRFVAGAGSAAYASGASATLADLSTSANRGRVLGANQAAALAGAAVGPALGGAIVAGTAAARTKSVAFLETMPSFPDASFVGDVGDVATRAPFFAVGLGCLYAAAHAFRGAPETLAKRATTKKKTRAARTESSETVDPASARSTATNVSEGEEKPPRVKYARDEPEKAARVRRARRDFFAASGVNAALFFSGSGGRATLVPLLAASTHGCDVAEIGALFSAMALTSLLGAAPAAALADAAPRRAVVSAAMALSSVAVLATAAAPTKELFAVAAVAWSASHALMGPAPAAYAADVAGPRAARGRALATYRTCGDVGMLLGPVALGAAADAFGAPSALAANGAALGAAAAAFRATASDRDHRRARAKSRRKG